MVLSSSLYTVTCMTFFSLLLVHTAVSIVNVSESVVTTLAIISVFVITDRLPED